MGHTMKAKRTPQDHEKTLADWARHWPFERASTELIRRAQAAQRNLNRVPPAVKHGEPAPF